MDHHTSKAFRGIVCCGGALITLFAQAQTAEDVVRSWMQGHRAGVGLAGRDIAELEVSSSHTGAKGISYVYMQQRVHGIPVAGAVANFAVRQGRVVQFGDRLRRDVTVQVNGSTPMVDAEGALRAAARELGLPLGRARVEHRASARDVLFAGNGISKAAIPAGLIYSPVGGDELRLAWELEIRPPGTDHWWRTVVDAHTGRVLSKQDRVVHCSFPQQAFAKGYQAMQDLALPRPAAAAPMPPDGSSYRVFAFPVESPTYGPQTVVTDPADLLASPNGWHDTDGQAGAEYTITRGNNVYAGEDINNDDIIGYSTDGGAALTFDAFFTPPQDPADYLDAAITNLFYTCNVLHDVWYRYGFDEASGNFQETNYSGAGLGSDAIYAQAQDGSGTNNANFATPPDGSPGAMQMYLWRTSENDTFRVNSPGTVAGTYTIEVAGFGPLLPSSPITADLVLVDDGADPVTDACEDPVNGAALSGKIAVVDRGTCTFVSKVQRLEAAGALAVVVVNNVGGAPITMGGSDGGDITIPSVMISQADGLLLKEALEEGPVNGSLQGAGGESMRDSDFDNGIIAHEYGHGVSTRLTGGSGNADCLWNEEQMGEGWGDWMGMVLTMQVGDLQETPRGVGNFVQDEGPDGQGIRPAPYSTDFAVNPYTYGITNTGQFAETHALGFVWATMLWDLTWDLVEAEGFDPDIHAGSGGNNTAMQLVMDGLKLQPCDPGFVDGRNAILKADSLDFGAEHACLIWNAFARRGLGYGASQGSSFSVNDQVEAFDVPAGCELVGVPENLSRLPGGFVLLPNPARSSVLLQTGAPLRQSAVVRVVAMDGRQAREHRFTGGEELRMDLQGVAAGVYMVQMEVGGKRLQERLVVE
jgi:extracellular elastinolytic metalloproteinase